MEHSASRRLDVLQREAPHLIAAPLNLEAARRLTRDTAGTLKLAIETARRDYTERGGVRDELWQLMDRLAGELATRLGELERAERAAGLRPDEDGGDRPRRLGLIPPAAARP